MNMKKLIKLFALIMVIIIVCLSFSGCHTDNLNKVNAVGSDENSVDLPVSTDTPENTYDLDSNESSDDFPVSTDTPEKTYDLDTDESNDDHQIIKDTLKKMHAVYGDESSDDTIIHNGVKYKKIVSSNIPDFILNSDPDFKLEGDSEDLFVKFDSEDNLANTFITRITYCENMLLVTTPDISTPSLIKSYTFHSSDFYYISDDKSFLYLLTDYSEDRNSFYANDLYFEVCFETEPFYYYCKADIYEEIKALEEKD